MYIIRIPSYNDAYKGIIFRLRISGVNTTPASISRECGCMVFSCLLDEYTVIDTLPRIMASQSFCLYRWKFRGKCIIALSTRTGGSISRQSLLLYWAANSRDNMTMSVTQLSVHSIFLLFFINDEIWKKFEEAMQCHS